MQLERRALIVNADDFGQSRGINSGVIKAREHGIVTSASLMVRWPAAVDAADYSRHQRGFSVGLHVDLGEWAFRGDQWVSIYEVVRLDDVGAVESEVSRQLSSFRKLLDRDPTHLDSHQHVHTRGPIAAVFLDLANKLGVPLRHSVPRIRYCGDLYGQTGTGQPIEGAITVERMIEILERLPPGVTELSCHPGEAKGVESAYRDEREMELKVLCDPRVTATIEKERIELTSFSDLGSSS